MLLKLLALFTIVPLVELVLLVVMSFYLGSQWWLTIALVVATAVLGAVLSKLEGKRAWSKIKQDLREGKIPRDSILDGLAVLIAGAFLLTPGVLTDIAAMVLLIPPARKPLKAFARKRLKKMLDSGQANIVTSGSFSMFEAGGGDKESRQGARPFRQSPFGRQDDEDVIDVTGGADDDDSSRPDSSDPREPEHINN